MPIVDVQIVAAPTPADAPTQALADALGKVFGSAPGRTWVRVQRLPATHYAENARALAEGEWPVFVTVLHARAPQGTARVEELRAVTAAVAQCLRRPVERVHVRYAADGAGRQAFGGVLVE
ncbi:MAG: tautomerase family protein [Betaproteobacteria bacterium]